MKSGEVVLLFGVVAALVWMIFLISGSALIGGSIFKPVWVKRRANPVGYVAVMLSLGAVAAFGLFEGLSELGWLPT